jgi:hypothetical protein
MISTRARTWIVTGALALGAAVGAAGVANAAGGSSSTTNGTATSRPAMANPATVSHGPGETLLTGTAASKARAAALAAVPGATVIRVETDSAGAAYEAHLRKADGSYVTVKMNGSFTVTATDSGFGGPGPGAPPAPPAQ